MFLPTLQSNCKDNFFTCVLSTCKLSMRTATPPEWASKQLQLQSLPRVSSSFHYIFSVTHLYSWVERSTVVEIYTVWCLRLLLHGPNSDQIWLSWNGAQSTQTIRLPIDFKLWKEVLNKEINVIPSECLNPMEGNICPMSSLCLLRPWIWRKKWSNVQISMANSIIARATSHDYADLSYFV